MGNFHFINISPLSNNISTNNAQNIRVNWRLVLTLLVLIWVEYNPQSPTKILEQQLEGVNKQQNRSDIFRFFL